MQGQAVRSDRPPPWRAAFLPAAIASVLVLLAAPLGTRAGLWPYGIGLLAVAASGAAALLVAVASAAASVVWGRRRHAREARGALLAAVVSLIPALVVGAQIGRGARLPAIHDVTTDPEAPPRFESPEIKGAHRENALEYGGAEIAELQRAAYPDVVPIALDADSGRAFEFARDAARTLGWNVVLEDPVDGRLEAVATTFWFGFKDDVAIRVRPTPSGSVVDVRSVSRVGLSDVGANAARIRRFTRTLLD
jgi:uncharacterized protein (DUF1499 family)